jgi:hypothetical protein
VPSEEGWEWEGGRGGGGGGGGGGLENGWDRRRNEGLEFPNNQRALSGEISQKILEERMRRGEKKRMERLVRDDKLDHLNRKGG